MHADISNKKPLLHRLKIIQGHLKKVIAMVEGDDYCIDIIHQSQAIQSALQKVDAVILESHLNECVIPKVKAGETDEITQEIMKIFQKKGA